MPTICGLRKPGNEPKTFVIPMMTPANLGAISNRFTAYPVAFTPVIPTPMQRNTIPMVGTGLYPTARINMAATVQP